MTKQDLIEAWKSGRTIQVLYKNSVEWKDLMRPQFKDGVKYRIKPDDEPISDDLKSAMTFTAGALFGTFLTYFAG